MPSRPDVVEELRQQARALLSAAKAGDPDAIERMRTVSDRVELPPLDRMTLSAAELAIAREHGSASFSFLRDHVDGHRRLRAIAESPTALDDLLAQARTLLRNAQAGDRDASERMRAISGVISLSVAQDAIARESSGWANWGAFSHRVESLRRIVRTPRPAPDPPTPATIRAWQGSAVGRWAGFPVGADPRPVVLTGGAVRLGDRFAGDSFEFVEGDFKHAFALGLVEGAPGVPEEPVRLLRQRRRPVPKERSGPPLVLTRADRSETEFWTDRGRRTLSAWRIESSGARGAIWALDEAAHAECWFPPPSPVPAEPGHLRRPDLQCATLFPDGVTLRVRFRGELETMVAYDGSVLETSTAVCVIPVERPLQEDGRQTASWPLAADSHQRELTIRLDSPLGARTLVGQGGHPVTVLTWSVTERYDRRSFAPPRDSTGRPPTEAAPS